ncbi:hypothetical protein DH2020_031401 [Rehmannia glutinosa]|uniref:Uncharacterized protein n=1 Tax=Rehmannia glutinosa TaxID=99300 RepID=A0ABR0VM52_REHGL
MGSSDSESVPVSSPKPSNSFGEIDFGGLIQVDYFSLDSQIRFGEDLDDDKSAESDNPSWIDPGLEENPTPYLNKESGEFWTDSSSERSEDREFSESGGRKGMGFSEIEKKEPSVEGIGEILEEKGEDLGKFCLDSSGMEVSSPKNEDVPEDSQVDVEVSGEKNENEKIQSGGNKKTGEVEKRSVVWWKMLMEFLEYCV